MAPRAGFESLVCPSCLSSFSVGERFCPSCGLPLVRPGALVGEEPISDRHKRARKVKPQLTEGQLVRVAGGRNQAEAEFIQGLLLEEGVPSLLRRSAGFDVPDFLAAGPRDVLVPESGAATAREVLLEAELISTEPVTQRIVSPVWLMAGILAALAIAAVVVWVAIAAGR